MAKVYYFHNRDRTRVHGPAVTLALTKTEEGINIGWASCSQHDLFCRRLGRTIASGRLEKRPLQTYSEDETFRAIKRLKGSSPEFADYVTTFCERNNLV